jgi:hypothetical protein
MHGVVFEPPAPAAADHPNRADVALFVGFVHRRRGQPGEERGAGASAAALRAQPRRGLAEDARAAGPSPLPLEVWRWLDERGWASGPYARSPRELRALLDVPVPLESWEAFARLFCPGFRRLDAAGGRGMGYLDAAVRSFFEQGGRRCYVVRVGRPWRYTAPAALRMERLDRLVPGWFSGLPPSRAERESWRGVAHLFGLPDVSFVCLPDLADVVRPDPAPPVPLVPLPTRPEGFVECSDEPPPPPADPAWRRYPAPRVDRQGFAAWAQVVNVVGSMLRTYHREAHLVAAVPLPAPELVADVPGGRVAAGDDLLGFLLEPRVGPGGRSLPGLGLASAFVQLAYPWARTAAAGLLPEGLEPPDGVLAGVLARNALLRGAYRSAAGLPLEGVQAVHPELGRGQLEREHPYGAGTGTRTLQDRVSILGPTPAGFRLLSDVTTSDDENYRPAAVSRLVSALVRAARVQGEDATFEPGGEGLWARLRQRLDALLLGLLREGALRGDTVADAFQVRCDRTTMTQNDLDAGRVVAHVLFQPTAPVDLISVVLASETGGGGLRSAGAAREAA